MRGGESGAADLEDGGDLHTREARPHVCEREDERALDLAVDLEPKRVFIEHHDRACARISLLCQRRKRGREMHRGCGHTRARRA
jgi:hypothetical protein